MRRAGLVIMSAQDFIGTGGSPPDWLCKARSGAERRRLNTLTHADINLEAVAHQRRKKALVIRRGE